MKNIIKDSIIKGECVYGLSSMELINDSWPKVFANCGLDFYWIDMEHSCMSIETVGKCIWACRTAGISPVVRLPNSKRYFVSKILDAGCNNIIIPRIEEARQVEDTIKHAFFNPKGDRSFAGSGRNFDLLPPKDINTAIEELNNNAFVGIQIETVKGIENIDKLICFSEIDMVFIGPGDLTLSLGIPGRFDHPDYIAAVDEIVKASKKYNHCVGIQAGNVKNAKIAMRKGVQFIAFGSALGILREQIVKKLNDLKK